MSRHLLLPLLSLLVFGFASSATAIPSLQLGPGTGNWSYDETTQTWVTPDDPLNLLATANATDGKGAYAWDPAGSADQIAYLVISAAPSTNFDSFDLTVVNDMSVLTIIESGFGQPPASDPNDLAPHGIFPTYYEVYAFDFDGAVTTISDTQPGTSGTGNGFVESFDITINSIADGGEIHFDLFTMDGDGTLANNDSISRFAPFSHDAGTHPVPEPSAALAFGVGLAVLSSRIRRRGA